MIEVWGRLNAYNVQKVIWTLHELRLEYIHHDVGSTPGDLDNASFLSRNPHARIPVIRDKAEYIWESNTIIRYLCSVYGKEILWSDNPLIRSLADRWMDWELATLQPDFIDLFWNYYRTPDKDRDVLRIASVKERCETHLKKLNQHLKKQKYIVGCAFSMGDIPCATMLYRYFTMGLNVEKPKYVMAWYERLSAREAYQLCIMTSYQALKGRVQF
jgi:glutathione S-transferase